MSEPQSPHSPRDGEDTSGAASRARRGDRSDETQQAADGIDPYGDLPKPTPTPDSSPDRQQPPGGTDSTSSHGHSPRSRPSSEMSADAAAEVPTPDQGAAGGSGQPTDAIAAYQVHSRRGPILLIGLVTLAIVVAIVIVALRPPSIDPKPTAVTPSPSVAASPTTSSSGGSASVTSSIPVSTAGFSGTWTIESSSWDSTGVTVEMTLTASSGSLYYTFFGLDNSSTDEVHATGAMASGSISAGQTQHGEIRMDKARGDTTLILAGQNQRQITALLVPA